MTRSYRFFIYGFGLCIGYLGITDTHSLMYAAGQTEDGLFLVYSIIFFSLLGFVDIIANHGFRECIPFLKHNRHFILAGLAACMLMQMYIGYTSLRSNGVIIFYLWPGLFTMAIAIIDARKRKGELCGLL